jgi:hypothetical protein
MGNRLAVRVSRDDTPIFRLGIALGGRRTNRTLQVVFRPGSNFFPEFRQSQEVRRPEVSRCSPNSLKGQGNFIAESPLLYLPIRGF